MRRPAAFWEDLFDSISLGGGGGDKKAFAPPASTEGMVKDLQDYMLTSVEKALPRIDMDLPAGLRLGVYDGNGSVLAPPEAELTPREVVLADRDFAASWILMFDGLKNSQNLCVLFRTDKLAKRARREWGDYGAARIEGFPSGKSMDDPAVTMAKAIANRPFVVVVSPQKRQLEVMKLLDDVEDIKAMFILLNAGLRGLPDGAQNIQKEMAARYNPAFHVSRVGPAGEGLLCHALGADWVVARCAEPQQEVLRKSDEPTVEEVEAALRR